jgi:hypothetical protein
MWHKVSFFLRSLTSLGSNEIQMASYLLSQIGGLSHDLEDLLQAKMDYALLQYQTDNQAEVQYNA